MLVAIVAVVLLSVGDVSAYSHYRSSSRTVSSSMGRMTTTLHGNQRRRTHSKIGNGVSSMSLDASASTNSKSPSTPSSASPPSSSSTSASNSDTIGVPRLHHDLSGLIRWIEKSGGLFDAGVQKGNEGWSLVANRAIEPGEAILKIPRSICIFSNPSYMEVPLLENAQLLMTSLEPNQWRARLAVALLSERVRPSSHYRAYLRNLPFEFWGMPVFYSTQEFSVMQVYL